MGGSLPRSGDAKRSPVKRKPRALFTCSVLIWHLVSFHGSFPYIDLHRDITMAYGYRSKDPRLWMLTPYEFIVDWEVLPASKPVPGAWKDTEHVEVRSPPAKGDKAMPGVHFVVKSGGVGERGCVWLPLMTSKKKTHPTFCHAYVLSRRVRPVAPSAVFDSRQLEIAEVLNVLHRQWTFCEEEADEYVPFSKALRREGQSWWEALLGWAKEQGPTSEACRRWLLKMAWRFIGRELAEDEDEGDKFSSKDEPRANIDYNADVPDIAVKDGNSREGVEAGTRFLRTDRRRKCKLDPAAVAAGEETMKEVRRWREVKGGDEGEGQDTAGNRITKRNLACTKTTAGACALSRGCTPAE